MTVFDQKERTLEGPSDYNIDPYKYFNNSQRVDIGVVRDTIESWFEKYPEEEKEEMIARFKVSFDDTYFELYIFTLFSALGYKLSVHPEIPGTLKTPDFKAEKDNETFYIEVKHISLLSQTERGQERRKNVLLDGLNKIDGSNFLLNLIEINFKEQSQPSNRTIINFFNDAIGKLDPDQYELDLIKVGFGAMPPIIYEDEKVRIELSLIPKVAHLRGPSARAIGSHDYVTKWGNDSASIKSALESKGSRYGRLNAPYIICLNKRSIGLDTLELQESLYGSIEYSWSTNPTDKDERLGFSGNGFFGSAKNKKFTRVSGVYLTNASEGNLVRYAEHAFRHNNFAEFPINLEIPKSIKSILNLKDGYPDE